MLRRSARDEVASREVRISANLCEGRRSEKLVYSLVKLSSCYVYEFAALPIHFELGRPRLKVTRIGRRVFLTTDELERIRREGLPSLATPAGQIEART